MFLNSFIELSIQEVADTIRGIMGILFWVNNFYVGKEVNRLLNLSKSKLKNHDWTIYWILQTQAPHAQNWASGR